MLSHGLWSAASAAIPTVIGKTISLSGDPYTIIGVSSRASTCQEFGADPDVWMPFQLDPNIHRPGPLLPGAGRLKPGVTLEQAKARMQAVGRRVQAEVSQRARPNQGFSVDPFQEALVSNVRRHCWCSRRRQLRAADRLRERRQPAAGARDRRRKREIAIRAAIGAGRGRIIRQLLTESVVLSLAGGALGLVLGVIGIRALLVDQHRRPAAHRRGRRRSSGWTGACSRFTLVVSLGTGHAVRPDSGAPGLARRPRARR